MSSRRPKSSNSIHRQLLLQVTEAFIVAERREKTLAQNPNDEKGRRLDPDVEDIEIAVEGLPNSICPAKMELLGNNNDGYSRTLVIPDKALNPEEEAFGKFLSRLMLAVITGTSSNCRADYSTATAEDKDSNIALARQIDEEKIPSEDGGNRCERFSYNTGIAAEKNNCFLMRLWEALASLHQCHRVVRKGRVDPNSGVRESGYKILWPQQPPALPGTTTTTTTTTSSTSEKDTPDDGGCWITVTEQGVRQSFDLTRVMFSRGNISEKIRFGRTLVQPGERVLDLYAGIGYFTLPALVHGKAQHVTACEWNPHAVTALQYNLRDNGIANDRFTVLQGDCRVVAREQNLVDRFDRVSLGLLPSSEGGWRTAVRSLNQTRGGWLHVHANVRAAEADQWRLWLCAQLRDIHEQSRRDRQQQGAASTADCWAVLSTHLETVKSFAPTVNHYVADVYLGPVPLQIVSAHVAASAGTLAAVATMAAGAAGMLVTTDGENDGKQPNQKNYSIKLCPDSVPPPSCALAPDGVLHQSWMRENEVKVQIT